MTILRFTQDYLASLTDDATKSPRLRQHTNIHTSFEDPCQRLLIAIGMDSYIRPHRHLLDPKPELMIPIRGLFALLTFDENGGILEKIKFGTEKYGASPELSAGLNLPPEIWHTVVALVPDAVLLEAKAGPFNPNAAKELARWAPEERTQEGQAFLSAIKAKSGLPSLKGGNPPPNLWSL